MGWMEGYNKIFHYIEENLDGEISYDTIAGLLGYSIYHVQRLFLLLAGISLSEYIRNRRLSSAATDLQSGDYKVIDVGLKYGYSTPASFNRAFKAMHGITPNQVKKEGVTIKNYPALTFDLVLKGGLLLSYRIERTETFRIVGFKLHTTLENGECYQNIPKFIQECLQQGKANDLLALMNQEPYGILGVSNYDPQADSSEFDYYFACASTQPLGEGMEEYIIPASTWAVFPCESIEELSALEQRVVMDWLPSSGYEFGNAPDIEVYPADNKPFAWIPIIKQ